MRFEFAKLARWKRVTAYVAFTIVAFLFFLAATFPYDAIRARIVMEAAAQGFAVRIGSVHPGFFGLTASDVRLSKPANPLRPETLSTLANGDERARSMLPPAELGEALQITSVSVRPSLFPLGVAFRARMLDGTVAGSVGGLTSLSANLDLDGLKASSGNMKGFTGMDLEGTIQGHLSIQAPNGTAESKGVDFSKANGTLTLDTSGLIVKGGTVIVPLYGTPTPMDLPRIELGTFTAELNIVDGLGTLEEMSGKSSDLELLGAGTVKLARNIEYSVPALDFRIKAEPEFTKRLGIIGAGLTVLPTDRKDPNFRLARLTGMLGRPKFGPGR